MGEGKKTYMGTLERNESHEVNLSPPPPTLDVLMVVTQVLQYKTQCERKHDVAHPQSALRQHSLAHFQISSIVINPKLSALLKCLGSDNYH